MILLDSKDCGKNTEFVKVTKYQIRKLGENYMQMHMFVRIKIHMCSKPMFNSFPKSINHLEQEP